MSYKRASIDQYRKSAVQNASPLDLIIMLYDGALKFLETAKHHMSQDELYEQNKYCLKAQDIITELISCLDVNQGGEIAQNLFALYEFANNSIIEGNISQDSNKLDQAIEVLSSLRTSWVQVNEESKKQNTEQVNQNVA